MSESELRELLAKATPGPWSVERRYHPIDMDGQKFNTDGPALVMALGDCEIHPVADCSANHTCGHPCEDNAALIVAAVNALPGLLDELSTLRARVAEVEREAYELKLAAAGGEDAPGSANLVTVADVERWTKSYHADLKRYEADILRLTARAEDAEPRNG